MASKSIVSFLLVLCIMASCLSSGTEAVLWHAFKDWILGIDRPCVVQAECDVLWCPFLKAPRCEMPPMRDHPGRCKCGPWH